MTVPALQEEGRYKRTKEFGFNLVNSGETLVTFEQRCDNYYKGILSFIPARLLQGSGVEHGVEIGRTWSGGCWKSLTVLYWGIKDVTVSTSLPSTSHTCEIPQFNGKDINHLQQHICLKRRHQHENLATLNQLKEEHLPDIFIVVILIVHLLFFLQFVLLTYLYWFCQKNPWEKKEFVNYYFRKIKICTRIKVPYKLWVVGMHN